VIYQTHKAIKIAYDLYTAAGGNKAGSIVPFTLL
jgi:hypothetical protein